MTLAPTLPASVSPSVDAGSNHVLQNVINHVGRDQPVGQPLSALPKHVLSPEDSEKTWRENSLKIGGYGYLAGDGFITASGMMAGRTKEALAGGIYALGGLTCARYGNPDAEKQLELMCGKLGRYLEAQGITIPHDPDLAMLTKKGGLIQNIEEFLYKYPSQVFNAINAIAGSQLALSGIQHNKKLDAAAGALVTTGALAALLIPEKKPDPEHPAQSAMGKFGSWIQEKPNRAAGILYGLNNVALTASAFGEMRAPTAGKGFLERNSYVAKFLAAGSYTFANAMLTMSGKGHGDNAKGGSKAMEKLGEFSARVILAQPPELREALVQQIAGFMAAQPEAHLKADEISDLLHTKLAEVSRAEAKGKWTQAQVEPATTSLSR